jgi:hypothetical protein
MQPEWTVSAVDESSPLLSVISTVELPACQVSVKFHAVMFPFTVSTVNETPGAGIGPCPCSAVAPA